ncbi:pyridoxamine 5'-phosphate oxidase family protein [Wenyingzhuangia marina]|uniref:Pyridoxamine 5'-phosphate oxidase n=1 Tax=Wenyingzhuangia marina TaxID=1195760 RepID=A0A1M5VY57_9FLAO|nr:pyridoxamine 5'-phosphate oxidase family protein [Wenyingzhuangia marina]GGF77252.1 pyridoxamine 5'-phosphate oxidase [Wenyingzhuangia marina]SHH79863.1 Pyridoxamine 5'-phosphate oxidase [Wenyingzhuangia marina]
MGKKFTEIAPELQEFIKNQKIFFVGTAAETGNVNVSPKGMDSFRVINKNKIAWLNLTGSGNETAAHLLKNDRMTIMFCAFEGKPMILRLYGTAKIYHPRDQEYQDFIDLFPETPGSRQVIEMEVDLVQTSCGYAVPFMDYKEDRTVLKNWAQKQGQEKIETYWEEKNTVSIDGFETRILE